MEEEECSDEYWQKVEEEFDPEWWGSDGTDDEED